MNPTMKNSWSPIIIDGLILFAISTVFVVLLDIAFKSLPSAEDTSNPLVSEILQSATLGSKKTGISDSVKQTAQKDPSRVNQQDEHGDTPLMRTCYVNFDDYQATMSMDEIRLPYVLWLIEQKADVNTLDNNGWNALCWASWSGTIKIADALIKNGSNVNVADQQGNTPLSIAALRGNPEIIRILIASGANKKVTAKNGFKPVDFARQEFERYGATFSPNEELNALPPDSKKIDQNKSYFNNRNRIQRFKESIELLSE